MLTPQLIAELVRDARGDLGQRAFTMLLAISLEDYQRLESTGKCKHSRTIKGLSRYQQWDKAKEENWLRICLDDSAEDQNN